MRLNAEQKANRFGANLATEVNGDFLTVASAATAVNAFVQATSNPDDPKSFQKIRRWVINGWQAKRAQEELTRTSDNG